MGSRRARTRGRVVLLRGAWGGVRLRPAARKQRRKRPDGRDGGEEAKRDPVAAVQRVGFDALSRIPALCAEELASTWNLELPGDEDVVVPSAVLSAGRGAGRDPDLPRRFYSSFIVARSDRVKDILSSLPVGELPSDGKSPRTATTVNHGSAVWFFVGHNRSRRALPGRPEHTDAVRHDGTWHFQLSGSKTWHLRPTEELAKRLAVGSLRESMAGDDQGRITVRVDAGDILLVDTRQWWHHTELPCTLGAHEQLSVSYARDVWIGRSENGEDGEEEKEEGDDMCNVDWLYAPHDISCGTVVLTEDDVPDAELPESEDPNCEVVEDEFGRAVLIAARDIRAGEFSASKGAGEADD